MLILFYPKLDVTIFIDALEGRIRTLYLNVTVLDEDGVYRYDGGWKQSWRNGESQKLGVGRDIDRFDEGGWGEAGGAQGKRDWTIGEESKGVVDGGRHAGEDEDGLDA